ncbi:MAG TPA: class I SAM-dependent methyltransferase, partial [Kiritimatiellia bacterium]|nr:class I SAM-dependent methyltransferase [Kiritimatiellia bacterium]
GGERRLDTALNVACGGGKNLFTLKRMFKEAVGLDVSEGMIGLARELNPECRFELADMRDFDLGRRFDFILVDDGISHLTSEADLAAVFGRVFAHVEPGGVMMVTADTTKERFVQNQTTVAHGGDDKGVEVMFVETVYDSDPEDDRYEATHVYVIREEGRVRVESDTFGLGVFEEAIWQRCLEGAGFVVTKAIYAEGDEEYVTFAGLKKAGVNLKV